MTAHSCFLPCATWNSRVLGSTVMDKVYEVMDEFYSSGRWSGQSSEMGQGWIRRNQAHAVSQRSIYGQMPADMSKTLVTMVLD